MAIRGRYKLSQLKQGALKTLVSTNSTSYQEGKVHAKYAKTDIIIKSQSTQSSYFKLVSDFERA